MFKPGDVISYLQMCQEEDVNLQRGMNFHLQGNISVILMSLRAGAPYADKIEDDGKVLIYEGHDIPKKLNGPNPKTVDQPFQNPSGSLTQNGLFFKSAIDYKKNNISPELVRVYEKIRSGIWVYNGLFILVDAWHERDEFREVFKFKLELTDEVWDFKRQGKMGLDHNRLIPSQVKLEVWKRDHGKCVKCGSTNNLHYDHILPFSKGGSSLVSKNIQILCARHNLEKKDRIE